MGKLARGGLAAIVLRWASALRFPWLFLLTAGLFALNLIIPDALPFADEILMGLVALLLAGLKKKSTRKGSSVRAGNGKGNTDGAD
jgi:hypothetical protein